VAAGGYLPPADSPEWMPVPRLLRRPAGADRPFYRPNYGDDRALDLYEGLVFSPPGRYLWLRLTLTGTDRLTPAVRGLRAYYPRPSYLRYLPEIYREDAPAREFLDRLLSLFETFHSEVDGVRDHLSVLFEPDAVPREALDWLAGWLGLVLDPRWPEDRRRNLVAAAARLYRDRGTRTGLAAFLRLYTDRPFQLVEGFQTRNAGGIVVGADPSVGESVVGAGLVIHEPVSLVDSTRAWAHRFTLFVAAELTDEERSVIGDIVEVEKPAHTLGDICDVTETCTVGQHALVGISTLIGKARCLRPAVVGDQWPLGRDVVVGGERASRRTAEIGAINLGRNTFVR
jgi:phage tail-like protein